MTHQERNTQSNKIAHLAWKKKGRKRVGFHGLLWGHAPNDLETSPYALFPKVSPPPSNSSVRTFRRRSVQVAACISFPKITSSNEQSTSESQLNNSHSRTQFPARTVSVWKLSWEMEHSPLGHNSPNGGDWNKIIKYSEFRNNKTIGHHLWLSDLNKK